MTAPVQSTRVTGGAGGTRAQLESLRSAAGEIDDAAELLESVLGDLVRAALDPAALALGLAPVTGLRAEAACARFHVSAAGADLGLRALAAGVRTSADAYEAAETVVTRTFEMAVGAAATVLGQATRALLLSPAGVLLVAGTAGAFALGREAGSAAWRGARDVGLVDAIDAAFGIDTEALAEHGVETVTGWAAEAADTAQTQAARWAGDNPAAVEAAVEHALPGFVAGLLGHPPGASHLPVHTELLPQDSQTLTGLLLVGLSRWGLFGDQPLRPWHTPAPVDVRELAEDAAATPHHASAPAGVAALWQRQWARSRGLDNGQVRVEQIRAGGGASRWIVYVPATTSGALRPGHATSDMTSNLEAASGRRSSQHTTVREAMRRAGVPRGEQVMMVGYSQGGIIAASLLEDQEFREEYDVSALLTVGSPVGDFDLPAEVDALSVEHRQDLVPLLDGAANPDRAEWTTVRVDLDETMQRERMEEAGWSQAEIDARMAAPLHAHGGELYAATLEDLEAGGEPALRGWQERNAGFFSGELESTRDFEGRRR
jgi:hypothetical protein